MTLGLVDSAQPPHVAAEAPLRRLATLAPLSEPALEVIRRSLRRTAEMAARSEIVAYGEEIKRSFVIVQGWACRQRILPDGRRQIVSFSVPGDLIGLSRRPRSLALASIVALSPVTIADASPLREVLESDSRDHEDLKLACLAAEALDEAWLLNQVVRLGRQTAYERMAHLLLELRDRLRMVGLVEGGDRFTMPLTQEMLADVLGLSVVHVNRTLQQMRRERLIELKGASVELLEPAMLVALADYRMPRVSALAPAGELNKR